MRLFDLFETRTDESLKDFSYDMVKTVMDMFDIGQELAIEVVNRVQDYDAVGMATTLEAGDRRGFAQLYTDAKAGLSEGRHSSGSNVDTPNGPGQIIDHSGYEYKVKHEDGSVKWYNKSILTPRGNDDDLEEGMAWGRSGNKVVKKFRCTGGPRSGRVVSKPAQCFAPPDIKKRMTLKRTKAKMGKKMARKRKKTMRTNAASKRVQAMNRK